MSFVATTVISSLLIIILATLTCLQKHVIMRSYLTGLQVNWSSGRSCTMGTIHTKMNITVSGFSRPCKTLLQNYGLNHHLCHLVLRIEEDGKCCSRAILWYLISSLNVGTFFFVPATPNSASCLLHKTHISLGELIFLQ